MTDEEFAGLLQQVYAELWDRDRDCVRRQQLPYIIGLLDLVLASKERRNEAKMRAAVQEDQ